MNENLPSSPSNHTSHPIESEKPSEQFLDLLPLATILLDPKGKRILYANSKASEISLYTRSELTSLDPGLLIPDMDWKPEHGRDQPLSKIESTTPHSAKKTKKLVRRNSAPIEVNIFTSLMQPGEKGSLVFIQPNDSHEEDIMPDIVREQMWEGLRLLSMALLDHDLQHAIDLTLQAGNVLTGARILAVYQALEHDPVVQLYTTRGPTDLLPEQLSPVELMQLNAPQLWTPGKKPVGALHRSALSSKLSYISSAPIGQPNALSGLIVIADRNRPPSPYYTQITQLIGNNLTSIFQNHISLENMTSELSSQEGKILIKSTLEDQIHEGVITLNHDLTIFQINSAAENMLGFVNREVIRQSADKVIIGNETLLPLLSAAQNGSPTHNLRDIILYRRNGESFPALLRIYPISRQDSVDKILVLIQDLSEQEEKHRRIQQLEQRAVLGQFTASFAHEVRNPINNISTSLQLMSRNIASEDPNQEAISRMLQDCERLASLMKSVLAFSRANDYEMETLELPPLLERILERLQPRIRRLNIKTDLKIDPQCPQILGNARALEQVFNNLINNAIQAMGEAGGSLILKVYPMQSPDNQSFLEVSVADTGPGIPKEIQKDIFQPFFTTDKDGTGLGLAISQHILAVHKSNIRLESFPGGTVFFIQFPIARTEE